MPCDSGMSYSSGTDYEARRQVEFLTRISCDILRTLEQAGVELPFTSETAQWWEKHKAIDAAREQAEEVQRKKMALRAEAIAKLSPEELAALGLGRPDAKDV